MTSGPSDGHVWPTGDQRAMLAFMLNDKAPKSGTDQWLVRLVDAARTDPGIRGLMPMLHLHLSEFDPGNPLLETTRVWRVAHYARDEKQRMIWSDLVSALGDRDAMPVLLKGLSLGTDYYPHSSYRTVSDADLLVKPSQRSAACEVLREQGWVPEGGRQDRADALFEHAEPYALPARRFADVDLHVHVLSKCHSPAIDRWFEARSESFDFGGVTALRLEPTALLAHTLLHGLRWAQSTPIRWIIDAALIIERRGNDIDWDVLWAFAISHRFRWRLAMALLYLEREFEVAIPPDVCERCASHRPSAYERFEAGLLLRAFPLDATLFQRHAHLLWSVAWRASRMRGGRWLPVDMIRVARHLRGDADLLAALKRTASFGKRKLD